jgi:hypothetical protein
MTQPISTPSAPTRSIQNILEDIGIAAIATVAWTVIDPITGIALGTYLITCIASDVVADRLGWDNAGTISKVVKTCVSHFVGMATSLAVLSALAGTAIIFTPSVIGFVIVTTALNCIYAALHAYNYVALRSRPTSTEVNNAGFLVPVASP